MKSSNKQVCFCVIELVFSVSLNVIVFLFLPIVLRERLTDRELDFLNLPVSSLHHSVNQDRLSMTTDELLSIPHDGSMPVTHTSAFLQGLQTHHSYLYLHPMSSNASLWNYGIFLYFRHWLYDE